MTDTEKSTFYSKENLEKVTYAIRVIIRVMDHYGRQFNGTKPPKRIRALVNLFNRMANNLNGIEIILDHPKIDFSNVPFQVINTLLRPFIHDVFIGFYIGSIKEDAQAETELDILNLDFYSALKTIKSKFEEINGFDSTSFEKILGGFRKENSELFVADRVTKKSRKALRVADHDLGNQSITVTSVLEVLKQTDIKQLKELYAMYRLLSQYEHFSPWFQKNFAYKDDFEFGAIVQTMYSAIYGIVLMGGAIKMDDKGVKTLLKRAEELKEIMQA
jgi:hypothetical protein